MLVLTPITQALILSPAFASGLLPPCSPASSHFFYSLVVPYWVRDARPLSGFHRKSGVGTTLKGPRVEPSLNHLTSLFVTAPLPHVVYLTKGSIINANGFCTLCLAGSIIVRSAQSGWLAPELTRGCSGPFVSSAPYSSCFLSVSTLPFPC